MISAFDRSKHHSKKFFLHRPLHKRNIRYPKCFVTKPCKVSNGLTPFEQDRILLPVTLFEVMKPPKAKKKVQEIPQMQDGVAMVRPVLPRGMHQVVPFLFVLFEGSSLMSDEVQLELSITTFCAS